MGIFKQLKEYLFISKRDPNEPRTQWMKYMHGMNRISLFMFLIAVLIITITPEIHTTRRETTTITFILFTLAIIY